jgi:hypothetical protein
MSPALALNGNDEGKSPNGSRRREPARSGTPGIGAVAAVALSGISIRPILIVSNVGPATDDGINR